MNIYIGKKGSMARKATMVVLSKGKTKKLLEDGKADWGYGGDNAREDILSNAILTHEFGKPMGQDAEEFFKKSILHYQQGDQFYLTSNHILQWHKEYRLFCKTFDLWMKKIEMELRQLESKWKNQARLKPACA